MIKSLLMKLVHITKKILLVVALSFLLIVVMRLLGLSVMWGNLPPHQGDGIFEDRSMPLFWPFGVHAYNVRMPEFDMGDPINATYVVSNLPPTSNLNPLQIRGKLEVFLGFYKDNWTSILGQKKTIQDFKGNFSISVMDSNENCVLQIEGTMSNCKVMETRIDQQEFPFNQGRLLYPADQKVIFFTPKKGELYRLHIHYTPDPRLKGLKGFIFLYRSRF